jgi:hypothetical protein
MRIKIMSKRNVAVLALVILFALSVTAFAVATPKLTTGSDSGGVTTLASYRALTGKFVHPPQCPPNLPPGCGGG